MKSGVVVSLIQISKSLKWNLLQAHLLGVIQHKPISLLYLINHYCTESGWDTTVVMNDKKARILTIKRYNNTRNGYERRFNQEEIFRGNYNNEGLIVPKSKRRKTGQEKNSRSENEPYLFRIKFARGAGIQYSAYKVGALPFQANDVRRLIFWSNVTVTTP
jgi:hypothetical protein